MIINDDGGYGLLAAYIGGLAAQAGVLITWTEWTLAVALLQWQHYKCRRYYYYY